MRTIPFVFAASLLASCSAANGNAANNESSKAFALAGFDEVILRGSDDVRVIAGPAFSVVAKGPQVVLDQLEITVDGAALNIGRKDRKGWRWGWSPANRQGAIITVTMPLIRNARLAGSGEMRVDQANVADFAASVAGSGDLTIGTVTAKSLSATLTGSGNLTLDRISSEAIKGKTTGSGDLHVSGTAGLADVAVTGSGSIDGAGLATQSADVSVLGSGDISLRVIRSAKVVLTGSGDVTISGTTQCAVTKRGSGDVRCHS
jgi:Putative auto-transporter adhesin, head GIN domain